MSVHTETAAYRLDTMNGAAPVVLTRKSDGADVLFLGEDATRVLSEVVALDTGWREAHPETFGEMFDSWAEQFDDVMQVQGSVQRLLGGEG